MLDIIGAAAVRLLLLTVAVWLGLWLLRVRHPQLQLAAWTAVLVASLAMPLLLAVPITIPASLPSVAIDPKLLDGYVGAYELSPRLFFTVTRDGNTLRARVSGQQTFDLHPYSDRDFFYTVVAAQLTFVPGGDGTANALILHQNGRDQTAPRVDPARAAEVDQRLAAEREPHTAIRTDPRLIDLYVGRYRNADLEMTASREGDQMFVQVTGHNRYAVYPFNDHDFFATAMPAQISFTPGADGKADQLVRHEHGVDAVLNRVD